MKKVYSLFMAAILLAFVHSSFAQVKISGTFVEHPANLSVPKFSNPSPLAIDTLWPPVFTDSCFTNDPAPLVYYWLGPPNQGYLTGNNQIQGVVSSTEVAQRYTFTGNGNIQGALILYAYKNGSTSSTSVKIYSVNPTTLKPQNVLATSASVPMTSVDTTGMFTSYAFSPPLSVNNDFIVSAVLPTGGDTVAIASTKLVCNSMDSLSYMNLTQVGWYTYSLLLNAAPPKDTSIDIVIVPVVNITTGINESVSSGSLKLYGAFPSPASDFTILRYELDKASHVSIEVFDLTGKMFENYQADLTAGKHELKVNVRDLSAGNYYYTIRTAEGKLTSIFSVVE